MRTAGAASWVIREGDGLELAMALYVRDVAGLDTSTNPDAPPPLDPPVAVSQAGFTSAAPAWNAWWSSVLRRHDTAPTPRAAFLDAVDAAGGELRRLLDATLPAAEWWSQHHREPVRQMRPPLPPPYGIWITHLVAAIEKELGRRSAPFELNLVTLPVRGSWSRLTAAGLLLSYATRGDVIEMERMLRPLIVALA